MMKKTKSVICIFLSLLLTSTGFAQRQMEKLDRGVYAINAGNGKVFVSWRLLGTEPQNTSFELSRTTAGKRVILFRTTLTGATNFADTTADVSLENTYTICNGNAKCNYNAPGISFTLKPGSKPYLSIPLKTPPGYSANDASVGDLDGDGQYEVILHQTGRARDNSQAGLTDPPIFQAYKLDGTFLWEINLGKNIREGAHYTQFMVYDLDGDGRAEVAMKTADGTIDGKGNVIGDSTKDWRNARGYIVTGPEFLTVFNGLTGEAMATTDYIPPRYPTSLNPTEAELKTLWGDGYGNRFDRFLACVAYLDGVHPSLVMCRGYYTRTVLAAWDWKDKKLRKRWVFDTNEGFPLFAGQGNHNLTVTDVDDDGKDEIVYGQMTVDDNGKGLYTTRIGHSDALHVSNLDPSRPGLEVFSIQERFGDAGANFRDARTGEVIWKKASVAAGDDGEGPGRALAIDIDPRYEGAECWVAGAGIVGMFDCKGNKIADRTPACNMGIFWDGDDLSEVLNGVDIMKWNYDSSRANPIFSGRDYDCVSNNGTKANPCLSADILGDWREELIGRTRDSKELRIFCTTIPTQRRLYTLMHNPQYRLSIAWQNVAYNQPPHTDYFMGNGMKTPPKPNIVLTKK